MFRVLDEVRRAQGAVLEELGFGPTECSYRIVASGPHWMLREYGGSEAGPCLLIVAAPIKRPYIWDLAPQVSAVRFCLDHGLRVYLLEWASPSPGNGNAGLAEYAHQAIGEAVARLARETGTQPFLAGHSLGGTFAAIFGIVAPEAARGLVLLGAPLCFRPGISRFRDAIVAIAPSNLAEMEVVPGSLLSQLSAWASPETFVWSRLLDATASSADPAARAIHARVERWALDEVPLRARLVHEILQWLYREDRLCQGTLSIRDRIAGPSKLRVPMRMASIAAGVSLAHVCDRGFRVRRLDLERSNERVLGFDRHLIRLVPDLDADRIPQGHDGSLRNAAESGLGHPGT
jgi:polyhydroxyalkanoate synthase subunit PhaC